jgi:prepilin-type N-terminal cleavage/methylation domain-containing protein/prepilin-type processing-associated H-X9-DG protein
MTVARPRVWRIHQTLPDAQASRGFTLIELLVVLAVIAVLITLLMPALQSSRHTSRSVLCASNLRQLGLFYGIYAQNFADYLPQTVSLHPTLGFLAFDELLMAAKMPANPNPQNIEGVPSVLRCPANDLSWFRWYNTNYAGNYALGSSYATGHEYKRLAQIDRPGQCVQNLDSGANVPWPGNGYGPTLTTDVRFVAFSWLVQTTPPPHYGQASIGFEWHPGKRANMVFVDGHQESLNLDTTAQRWSDRTLLTYRVGASVHW